MPNNLYPTVKVSVTLNQSAKSMKIDLFTTAYRKILEETVLDVPLGTNYHSLVLKDKAGKPLANGVYYIVVTTTSGKAVGKLVILK